MKAMLLVLLHLVALKVALLILVVISACQIWAANQVFHQDLDLAVRLLGGGTLVLTGTISGFAAIVVAVFYFRTLQAFFWLLSKWPDRD